jgi:iron donor protein CyaY
MALSESAFLLLADASLNRLADMAEVLDDEEQLEIELSDGILTVTLPAGKQFLVNRHKPSLQLWYSSPLSGGLHFDYNEAEKAWLLEDGRRLDTLLKAEMEILLAEE